MNNNLRDLFGNLNKVRPQHTEEKTIYNFAFGALYALCRAHELGYQKHQRLKLTFEEDKLYRQVRLLAQKAEQGILPTKQRWLAGYFFNDALIRLDVSFEHLARYETNDRNTNDWRKLSNKCRGPLKDIINDSWKTIRMDVVRIKHRSIPTDLKEISNFDTVISIAQALLKGMLWITNNSPR